MTSLFFHYLTFSRPVGYTLVFLGMVIEGDIFLLSTSFLARLGYFDIFDFIGMAFLGTVVGNLFWYWLGFKFGAGNGAISRYVSHHVEKIKTNFDNKLFRKLLLSKFMYGTHHTTVVVIGISKLNFFKYILAEIPATITWLLIIGSLGYLFGSLFSVISGYLKYVEIAILLIVVIYILISRIIKKRNSGI